MGRGALELRVGPAALRAYGQNDRGSRVLPLQYAAEGGRFRAFGKEDLRSAGMP